MTQGEQADERGPAALAEIHKAMNHPDVRITLPYVLGQGVCVQVHIKTRKVGPVIIPNRPEQTLADTLHMLGTLAETAP